MASGNVRTQFAASIGALFTTFALAAAVGATGQELPRAYVASPDIYKLRAQNPESKVVEAAWKPGQRDVMHSHPKSAVYFLTDCDLRNHAPDGSTREQHPRAGMAILQEAIPGHVIENIGTADCRLVMFEGP